MTMMTTSPSLLRFPNTSRFLFYMFARLNSIWKLWRSGNVKNWSLTRTIRLDNSVIFSSFFIKKLYIWHAFKKQREKISQIRTPFTANTFLSCFKECLKLKLHLFKFTKKTFSIKKNTNAILQFNYSSKSRFLRIFCWNVKNWLNSTFIVSTKKKFCIL
jgi:hypothetical protein